MDVEIIGLALAASTSITSAVLSAISSKGSLTEAFAEYMLRRRAESAARPEDDPVDIRLLEVKATLRGQRRKATISRIASGLLTIGQYIVGGVLASSFMQEALSKPLVGALGVVVLMSSLFRQHWRPDIQYIGARYRATQLSSLIREAEDNIASAKLVAGQGMSKIELLRLLSDGLDSVEKSEVEELGSLADSHGVIKKPVGAAVSRTRKRGDGSKQ